MPQSIFLANATQYIDGSHTSSVNTSLWNLGTLNAGGTKLNLDRSLGSFDVFGPAQSGRALTHPDTITSAELILDCNAFLGPGGWTAWIERMTRADWDAASGDWNNYKTGSAWTTAGGDVGTPPAALSFASPVVLGDQTIAGMLDFVTDAIANRAGKVLLRLRANDESPSAGTKWAAFLADPALAVAPRLRVTYISADPAPIERPAHARSSGDAAAQVATPAGAASADRSAHAARIAGNDHSSKR